MVWKDLLDLFHDPIEPCNAFRRYNNDKFIAAHTVACIMDLRNPLQTVRNGFQQYIPILVSQSVIDMFEIIQIQIEQSAFAAFCLCF